MSSILITHPIKIIPFTMVDEEDLGVLPEDLFDSDLFEMTMAALEDEEEDTE